MCTLFLGLCIIVWTPFIYFDFNTIVFPESKIKVDNSKEKMQFYNCIFSIFNLDIKMVLVLKKGIFFFFTSLFYLVFPMLRFYVKTILMDFEVKTVPLTIFWGWKIYILKIKMDTFRDSKALAMCSSLERSDGHCIQVTITW